MAQPPLPDSMIRAAGWFAIVSGIISSIGVVFFIGMYVPLIGAPVKALGTTSGNLNDICVAIQYLLTIPIALTLHRILLPHNPSLIRIATPIGIASMVAVVVLQLLLIFKVLTFGQQVGWVSLAMLVGVGSWLIITGLVARSTGKLPNSVVMSAIAVPYFGYPVWAFWLGLRLLSW
jgi:hypothetical protein